MKRSPVRTSTDFRVYNQQVSSSRRYQFVPVRTRSSLIAAEQWTQPGVSTGMLQTLHRLGFNLPNALPRDLESDADLFERQRVGHAKSERRVMSAGDRRLQGILPKRTQNSLSVVEFCV